MHPQPTASELANDAVSRFDSSNNVNNADTGSWTACGNRNSSLSFVSCDQSGRKQQRGGSGGDQSGRRHHREGSGGMECFGSMRNSVYEVDAEFKINDLVGNGISGILYKWVNYGRGWRPRWFVLHDGVVSYYKIHGPDKICVNPRTERGAKVIGEGSIRRMSRRYNQTSNVQADGTSNQMFRGKPIGEVHLKVGFHIFIFITY